MTPIKFIHGVNTSEEQVRANVEWALAREVPKMTDRPCVIVGGGPSLSERSWHLVDTFLLCRDATAFCLNNAWREYQKNLDVEPDYIVIMDAREDNANFAECLEDATWLIASQCHMKLFQALFDADQDVRLWHVAGSEVVEEEGLRGIPGGGTVLSRTINIAVEMGFRDIVMAGVDSSHSDGKHHAYDQPLNDGEKTINVETPAGTKFTTTAELAEQANTVMNQMLTLERTGVTFEIIGDGLLPALWREHNELRSNPDVWEPEKYRRIWDRKEYRKHSPAMAMIDDIEMHAGSKLNTVIDFGCGAGLATAELIRRGYRATGVDFAANALSENVPFVEANLWSLPDYLKGDVGICIDVMEHIPPEKVDDVLENIAGAVTKCVFHIESRPDAMGAVIGETLHLSVHPQKWWINKLGEHFASVTTDNNLIICEVD